MAELPAVLDEELAGLDALEDIGRPRLSRSARLWAAAWPKLAALGVGTALWQLVAVSGWRPPWVLPGPVPVGAELVRLAGEADTWRAVGVTMSRAVVGYAIALVLGTTLGLAVARVRALRAAVGALLTGLQTMPSIAWFPLAILLFQLSEAAILFVVVLGAAPSVANGLLAGLDTVPPVTVRAARVLGARGLGLYRHVLLPAALPSFVTGLKQAWAFAWRSLMAGELLVVIAQRPSIGARLQFARELSDVPGLLALMIVVLAVGVAVDTVFSTGERALRRRWGYTV